MVTLAAKTPTLPGRRPTRPPLCATSPRANRPLKPAWARLNNKGLSRGGRPLRLPPRSVMNGGNSRGDGRSGHTTNPNGNGKQEIMSTSAATQVLHDVTRLDL